MSVVKVQGNASGTGQFTIAAPNSNNNRTMTLADTDGTIYIAPGNGIQALAAGVPVARSIAAGTGISVSNGDGVAGNPTITNSGVTSAVAGTGISVSGATGAVTITNSGVTSITAGSNISVSASTGSVTISSTAGAPTTAQVLSAYAGATAGGLGTYALLRGPVIPVGATAAGNLLEKIDSGGGASSAGFSGTWRQLGYREDSNPYTTLWLRIS